MTRCDGEFKQEKYHRQERDASKGGVGERGDRGAATIRCSTSQVAVKDASRRTLIVRADRSNTQVLERRNQTLSRMIPPRDRFDTTAIGVSHPATKASPQHAETISYQTVGPAKANEGSVEAMGCDGIDFEVLMLSVIIVLLL
jgi:hypothetical protein